jgi:D-Lysine 5,6-aminomutase TIM-barrel domain of alpha subunit
MAGFGDPSELAALRGRARDLAAAWSERARAATTAGQERAVLRMLGVTGTDREGRPLAARVVDQFIGGDTRRLAGGVTLPFALAMREYDRTAQELALDIAEGNVDLADEAELLADPAHCSVATDIAERLLRSALDRVDANRTARRELTALLGDPPPPWVGMTLSAPAIVDALDEARLAVDAGAALIAVSVPPARELLEGQERIGVPVETWRAAPSSRGGLDAHDPDGKPVPTGAQRALNVLRRHVDEAGARRRAYVRLITEAQPLAAPEQAVVAAFERIDAVIADPLREIVTGRVHPDRALADHVFAHRLLCRAGVRVLVPAGPLVVAPDMASGIPSDPATRSGRSLALQLLAIELAVLDGLAPADVSAGALPDWLADEPDPAARALAEVVVRRALLPEHALAFVEPELEPGSAPLWNAIVAAILPDAGLVDLVLRRASGGAAHGIAVTSAAAEVAHELRTARQVGALGGPAREHAERCLAAAADTLAALETTGWSALVDQPLGFDTAALGGAAVAARTSGFDPLLVGAASPA